MGSSNKFWNYLKYSKKKLDEDDYYVHVSNFYRDNILIPFIDYIVIHNIQKYEELKTKEMRKEKIFKINIL